mgnify:CR=1 FL=1
MSESFNANEQNYRLAHEYAWNWFSFHAQQRLTLFNFSLVALGALAAGCVSAFAQGWYLAAGLSAVFAGVVAFAFLRLDRRNSELTKLAEDYLKSGTEERLAPVVGDKIRLVAYADSPSASPFFTFGQVFRFVYRLAIFAAVSAALISGYLSQQ